MGDSVLATVVGVVVFAGNVVVALGVAEALAAGVLGVPVGSGEPDGSETSSVHAARHKANMIIKTMPELRGR